MVDFTHALAPNFLYRSARRAEEGRIWAFTFVACGAAFYGAQASIFMTTVREYSPPHTWSPDELIKAIGTEPFHRLEWDGAMTTCVPPELARDLAETLVRARFALVPPGEMRAGVKQERVFLDQVAEGRYGVSFASGLPSQALARRQMTQPLACPALTLTLPHSETAPLQVRPGFLRNLDRVFFWDGERFFHLDDSKLSVLTYWKTA